MGLERARMTEIFKSQWPSIFTIYDHYGADIRESVPPVSLAPCLLACFGAGLLRGISL
jgi:hypothetical protein